MDSAEEILKGIHAELSKPNPSDWKRFDLIMKDGTGEAIIRAMKAYASQAIDRCAEVNKQLVEASHEFDLERVNEAMKKFVKSELR